MNRLSFVAGAAAAFIIGAGWNALHSAPVPTTADGSQGMATMFASVGALGVLLDGAGAVTVSSGSDGNYDIVFERNVSRCALNAQALEVPKMATPYYVSGNTVSVVTGSTSAANIFDYHNAPFHLMVFCPR